MEWKSHAMHAPPPVPQALTEAGVHVWPEQQPFGQVASLQSAHVPALQIKPLQFSHLAPPAPQAIGSLPVMHMLPEQQPSHDWSSQTQTPPEHRWPVPHGSRPPHVHVPDEEQPSPLIPQVPHVCPATPHARPVGGLVHTLPVQHPPPHEVGVHSQDPFMQT